MVVQIRKLFVSVFAYAGQVIRVVKQVQSSRVDSFMQEQVIAYTALAIHDRIALWIVLSKPVVFFIYKRTDVCNDLFPRLIG